MTTRRSAAYTEWLTGTARRGGVIVDPTMRIIDVIPFAPAGEDAARVVEILSRQPPPERYAGIEAQAPVLYLPRAFEPGLCAHLIGLYQAQGGELSGFMQQIDGKTVGVHNPGH